MINPADKTKSHDAGIAQSMQEITGKLKHLSETKLLAQNDFNRLQQEEAAHKARLLELYGTDDINKLKEILIEWRNLDSAAVAAALAAVTAKEAALKELTSQIA